MKKKRKRKRKGKDTKKDFKYEKEEKRNNFSLVRGVSKLLVPKLSEQFHVWSLIQNDRFILRIKNGYFKGNLKISVINRLAP